MISDTIIASQAFQKGLLAAHSGVTPTCPYNQIYEPSNYQNWYDGLAQERRRINSVGETMTQYCECGRTFKSPDSPSPCPYCELQLTIDCVPYKVEQPTDNTLVMHSEHYAKLLKVQGRFPEKHAGFWFHHDEDDCQFVYVDADTEADTVDFESISRPLTLEMIETWWSCNFHAINELGYEVLERGN